MTRDLVVHHFGPDVATVGGMATVIRVLTEYRVGADVVDSRSTWRPDSRLATARLFAVAAWAIRRLPASDVVHVHLSERGSFVREGALIALAQRRGHTTVATIHGASFVSFANSHPRLVSAVLRRAELITCLDQEVLGLVERSAPGVRCELIPNPVFIDESRSSSADETGELVVFAGEIGLRKGADVLHRAWRIVAERRPQARCLMVGPVADFLPPDAERLDLAPATGPVEMAEIIRSARVVALPSRAEGMPMVLTEAMGLGRPFVSTPVGGIPELHAGGLLVAVDDHLALADRLTELLADPALARQIGERGRRFCAQTRSVEVIGKRLRECYLLARAGKRVL